MTATNMTPQATTGGAPAVTPGSPSRRGPLARAVAMEFVKLRTTAIWWGLLLLALLLVALNVAPIAALASVSEADAAADLGIAAGTAEGQLAIISGGYQSAYLLAAVLGTIIGAVDFRHRTATWTFLAVPGRGAVALAKLIVAAGFGLVYGVVGQATSLGLTVAVLGGRGIDLDLTADVWRSVGLGVLGIAAWALIGTAVGLLLRNQIGAILGVVGWVFLIDPIGTFLVSGIDEIGGVDPADVVAYSPNNASTAVVEGFAVSELLSWWGGVLVLLGYTAVLTMAAVASTLRRDVN